MSGPRDTRRQVRTRQARGACRLLAVVWLLCAPLTGQAEETDAGPPSRWHRTLEFSGYTWAVKASAGPVGPGPNYFSDSAESVWVDAQGRLHLRIAYREGHWRAAEVSLRQTLGYGTYTFTLGSVDGLDPNAVLGLFTWSDAAEDHHRELDIEVSRWGVPANDNGQCVVQPYELPGHIARFPVLPGLAETRHSIRWTPEEVTCRSDGLGTDGTPGAVIHSHSFTGWLPHSRDEHARINLWLIGGAEPTDGRDVEAVISGFRFEPGEPGEPGGG